MAYIRIACATHPKAKLSGQVAEHVLVAEKALGRYLPNGVEIHHFNEVKSDNRGENLVICPDHNYQPPASRQDGRAQCERQRQLAEMSVLQAV